MMHQPILMVIRKLDPDVGGVTGISAETGWYKNIYYWNIWLR